MENQEVDVVIVGSGIAGSVMAKILTKAGKKVLLLEAGLESGIALDAEGAYKTYVEAYLKTFYETAAKATNGPYPNITDAKSPDVLDIKAKTPYAIVSPTPQGAVSFYCHTQTITSKYS